MPSDPSQIVPDLIRAHVDLIHKLAAPLAGHGKVAVAGLGEVLSAPEHQSQELIQRLPPLGYQVKIGDVRQTLVYIAQFVKSRHYDLYIPLAVYALDPDHPQKGIEKKVIPIAYLGITIDFDDAEAARWAERLPISPNYVLETSAGRFQAFYFFEKPEPLDAVALVAKRLKAYARCEHGAPVISHHGCVAGSLSWSSARGLAEGRSPLPQLVRVAQAWDDGRTSLQALSAALPALEPTGHEPRPPEDVITVLTAADGKLLTKRIFLGSDGEPEFEPYGRASYFRFAARPVDNLDDLARVLDGVGPHSCAVNGRMTPGTNPGWAPRRHLEHRLEDGTIEPPTLEVAPHYWLPLDLDSIEAKDAEGEFDPVTDPERAVRHVLSLLPPELQGADCWWQLTSGAGFKPGIRLRLMFWLDRALTCYEVKRWLKPYLNEHPSKKHKSNTDRRVLDNAIYTPSQPIYVSKPVFEEIVDPVPRRSGIWRGDRRVVSPPEIPPAEAIMKDKAPREAKGRVDGQRSTLDGDDAHEIPQCGSATPGFVAITSGDVEGLIESPRQHPPSRKSKPDFVADVPEVVDDVIEYLSNEAPAIEGERGDPTTILVANRCGDLGATPATAYRLMFEYWNDRCIPPWNADQLRYKVESAYRSRRNEIGSDAGKPALLFTSTPYVTAQRFVRRCYTDCEGRETLLRYRGDYYTWTGTYYRELPEEELRGLLYAFLNRAVTVVQTKNGPRTKPFDPDRNEVGKVMDALPGLVIVQNHIEAPGWLHPIGGIGAALGASADEFIPCRNGQLHLIGRLFYHEPNLLNFNVLGFDYDSNAPEPGEWLKFLASLWPDDREAIGTLQEIFGYLVSARTDLQKIFLLLGPKRCGKGTILYMLKELLGHENVTSPTLTSLKGEFGLQPLIGKTAAMISDARMDFGGSQAVVVERLLTISGEDSLSVNRKNKTAWEGKLGTRFIIASNEALRLNDASGAIASRMVPLRIRVTFYGKEDLGLKERLKPELPGIFNWALQGLRRLTSRRHFMLPASSQSTMEEMEALASPILTFVAECCIIGPDQRVETDRLYSTWTTWCARTGLPPGSASEFGRKLAAAVPTMEKKRFGNGRDCGYRPWGYQGIGLRNGTGTFDEALAAE